MTTAHGSFAASAWGSGAWMFLEEIDGKLLVGKQPYKLPPGVHILQFNMVGNSLESRNTITFNFKPKHRYLLKGHREGLSFVAQLVDLSTTPETVVHSQNHSITARSVPFTVPAVN